MENGGNQGIRFSIRAGDLGTWVLVLFTSMGIVSTILWSYFSITDRLGTVEVKVSALERAVYDLQNRSGHK